MAKFSYRIYYKDNKTGKEGSFFVDADDKLQGMSRAVTEIERNLRHSDYRMEIELDRIY